jgi:hypothetical protein
LRTLVHGGGVTRAARRQRAWYDSEQIRGGWEREIRG